jgi:glycerol-3-phosphate O-acyltransferase
MDVFKKLEEYAAGRKMPQKYIDVSRQFFTSYIAATKQLGKSSEEANKSFMALIECVKDYLERPYDFEPYHQKVTAPYDFQALGVNFIRPLVDLTSSTIMRLQLADRIEQQLARKENVIFLANHQTELDPMIIHLLLEKTHPQLGADMIFVAGERVIIDPLAVPFSRGVNLLCIYSKKHIDNPPELKQEKQEHNRRTMLRMRDLLSEGGKAIYVAPSGGRDRPNQEGKVVVAPFDAASVQMLRLMAQQSERPTHFHPLTLVTYNILPPPNVVEKEIGEIRYTKGGAVHMAIGEEVDMDHFPGSDAMDKRQKREALSHFIWNQVNQDYQRLTQKV